MRWRPPIWSIQRLFAILAALSVMFAPTVAGANMVVSSHHGMQMQMMDVGQCQGPSNSNDHDKNGGEELLQHDVHGSRPYTLDSS